MTLREFLQLPVSEQAKIMKQKHRDELFALREGLATNDPETVEKAKDINVWYDWFKGYAKKGGGRR